MKKALLSMLFAALVLLISTPAMPQSTTISLQASNFLLIQNITASPGSIRGYKYNDLDGQGDHDAGEPGIQGWTIYLYKGVDPGSAILVSQTTTDSSGYYEFLELPLLPAGTYYYVYEEQVSGWIQTAPATSFYTVDPGLNVTDRDFGNMRDLGSISGYKYEDIDGQGDYDAGEPGIQGWTIYLYQGNPAVGEPSEATAFDWMVTDSSGYYEFIDLPAGTYYIYEEQVDGWIQTAPATPYYYTVPLDPGQNVYDQDFGNMEEQEQGDQGCTPGFWKNNADKKGAVAWIGYDPDGEFGTFEYAFGVEITIFLGGNKNKSTSYLTGPTLLEALGANGSGINLLARSAVAALLNACNSNIAYPLSEGEIIFLVQYAVAMGEEQAIGEELDYYNNLGCPINQKGEPILY